MLRPCSVTQAHYLSRYIRVQWIHIHQPSARAPFFIAPLILKRSNPLYKDNRFNSSGQSV